MTPIFAKIGRNSLKHVLIKKNINLPLFIYDIFSYTYHKSWVANKIVPNEWKIIVKKKEKENQVEKSYIHTINRANINFEWTFLLNSIFHFRHPAERLKAQIYVIIQREREFSTPKI